jgi:hypothetical protein
MKSQRLPAAVALSLIGVTCLACQTPRAVPADTVDPALSRYVISAVPSDVTNRCYLDFGGKVALVGYTIEPLGVVAPGKHVKLTLYWQALTPLAPGWSLFTHLLVPRQAHQISLDDAGPLRQSVPSQSGGKRQALSPSLWQSGMVYVDPLEFDMPRVNASEVTVVAGVWREALRVLKNGQPEDAQGFFPGLRLPVLSGPSDAAERGIVVHISTGQDEAYGTH